MSRLITHGAARLAAGAVSVSVTTPMDVSLARWDSAAAEVVFDVGAPLGAGPRRHMPGDPVPWLAWWRGSTPANAGGEDRRHR
jgi:hypothetical protein